MDVPSAIWYQNESLLVDGELDVFEVPTDNYTFRSEDVFYMGKFVVSNNVTKRFINYIADRKLLVNCHGEFWSYAVTAREYVPYGCMPLSQFGMKDVVDHALGKKLRAALSERADVVRVMDGLRLAVDQLGNSEVERHNCILSIPYGD